MATTTATSTALGGDAVGARGELEGFVLEVGAARSGTNFLGDLLSQHRQLAYWRRPKYVWRHGNAWHPDDCLTAEMATPRVRRYIRGRFVEYVRKSGKPRLLVCTQSNSLALDFVNAVVPEAKIIHIIRDGREVAASQAKEWEIHSSLTKSIGNRPPFLKLLARRVKEVPLTDLPAYFAEFAGTVGTMLAGSKSRYSMGPKIKDWQRLKREMHRLAFTARTWQECVTAAREVGRRLGPERYLEVRFEDVVRAPGEAVPRMLEFMNLPPSPEIDRWVAERVKPETAGKWVGRFSEDELALIMPYVETLCRDLGYL